MIRSISAFLLLLISHGILRSEAVKGIILDSDSIPNVNARITAFTTDSVI